MAGCLIGETSGVTSKGVEVWVASRMSKFDERPDGGLESVDGDWALLVCLVIAKAVFRSDLVSVGLLEKRPEVSLYVFESARVPECVV